MKLPDFYKFEPLNQLRRAMGIAEDHYGTIEVAVVPSPRLSPEELDRLRNEGIDVYFHEITILDDGTLAYENERVLLHIRDVHVYRQQENEPSYHLFNCITLKDMTQKGRFERYVAAQKSNGEFTIHLHRNNKLVSKDDHAHLLVCRHCLNSLRLKGYSSRLREREKARIVAEFTPDDFFKKYPQSLHSAKPKYNSDTAPPNEYPLDWPEISERLRRENGYQCEKCRNNFSHRRQDLHVHHVNGLRWDIQRQNLKILCVACHANEPQHSHMRKTRQLMPTL